MSKQSWPVRDETFLSLDKDDIIHWCGTIGVRLPGCPLSTWAFIYAVIALLPTATESDIEHAELYLRNRNFSVSYSKTGGEYALATVQRGDKEFRIPLSTLKLA